MTTATVQSTIVVPDITETDTLPGLGGSGAPSGPPGPVAGRDSRFATSADLYRRWERQQWSVAAVDPSRDQQAWQALSPFVRAQMLGTLAELEVGEVCVTHTLGALVEHARTEDDRIYLCTQLADEARHVRFFQTYLEEGCGVPRSETAGAELEATADYAHKFAPELIRVTDAVRDGHGDADMWYRALVYYHLVTEGMLAATALRTTRILARRLGLAALDEGLTNVTRDESRHVSFGLHAAREGVRGGHRETIVDAHYAAMDMAAWVMIGPSRRSPAPAIRAALRSRAAQLQANVDIAGERLVKQLGMIGLAEETERASAAWLRGIDKALDAYAQRWDAEHPIRAVAA